MKLVPSVIHLPLRIWPHSTNNVGDGVLLQRQIYGNWSETDLSQQKMLQFPLSTFSTTQFRCLWVLLDFLPHVLWSHRVFISVSGFCFILFFIALEFAATGGTVFVADPSVWDELWPKLVVFLPVIIYIILCAIDSLKDYQLKVASALSSIFSFLMLYVFVAVIVQGKLKKGLKFFMQKTNKVEHLSHWKGWSEQSL